MRPTARSLRAGIALLLLLGAAPLAAQSACLGVAVDGVAGPVIFADALETGDTSRWGGPALPTWSTAATEDLAITLDFDPALAGEHVVELRWHLPGNALYQSAALPFTAGDSLQSAARVLPGYPFPLAVRTLAVRSLRGVAGDSPTLALVERLPVAGTSITESGLWGDWRVEVFLDGGEEPCVAPLDFRLEP